MSSLTKAEATKLAKELAVRLGSNWEPSVTQNIDWHYGANLKGSISVASAEVIANHHFDCIDYTIYLRSAPFESILTDRDPAKLLKAAMSDLSEQIRAVNVAHSHLVDRLNGSPVVSFQRPD